GPARAQHFDRVDELARRFRDDDADSVLAEVVSDLTLDGAHLRDGRVGIEAERDALVVLRVDGRHFSPPRLTKALEDRRIPFDGVEDANRPLRVDQPRREAREPLLI